MLMHRLVIIAALVHVSVTMVPRVTAAESTDPTAEGPAVAAQAFDAGDYDRAIAEYEAAIKGGAANGHLLYNLGIAYYRKDRLGDAMAAFLGARRLLPRDPDVRANLRFVTAKIRDKLEIDPPTTGFRALTFWTSATTTRELAWVFFVTSGLSLLAVVASFVLPKLVPARNSALATLLIPLLAAALLAVSVSESERWGAVTANQTTVYSGPDKSTVLFELQEGAPFAAEDRSEQGFWRIELSDGKKGWVSGSDVKVF